MAGERFDLTKHGPIIPRERPLEWGVGVHAVRIDLGVQNTPSCGFGKLSVCLFHRLSIGICQNRVMFCNDLILFGI